MNLKNSSHSEQGFNLVEVMTALVIFAITASSAGRLFMNERFSNINSQTRTGSVAVSQQILDELRQRDPSTMPGSRAAEAEETRSSINAMGHTYNATIHYCENSAFCGTGSRHIRVEVISNGQTVYNVETVYTRFQ